MAVEGRRHSIGSQFPEVKHRIKIHSNWTRCSIFVGLAQVPRKLSAEEKVRRASLDGVSLMNVPLSQAEAFLDSPLGLDGESSGTPKTDESLESYCHCKQIPHLKWRQLRGSDPIGETRVTVRRVGRTRRLDEAAPFRVCRLWSATQRSFSASLL